MQRQGEGTPQVREVDYSENGRRYRVRLPDEAGDDEAPDGIPVGPPDVVDALGLPEPFATSLHNELHRRGLWNVKIVSRRPELLQGALQAALKVDVQLLQEAFAKYEREAL